MRTYTAYSVGVGIVWAVLLVLASWLARYVYPPPKRYPQDTGTAP
jgi:hypothetical protein